MVASAEPINNWTLAVWALVGVASLSVVAWKVNQREPSPPPEPPLPPRTATTGAEIFSIDGIQAIGPDPDAPYAGGPGHYLPADMDAYIVAVQDLVELQDGDGVGDAPGLRQPVHTWEIDPDPDLHHAQAPRVADDIFRQVLYETPAEYAVLALATSRAIGAADPDATVLLGTMSTLTTPQGRSYLQRVVATPGLLDAVDAVALRAVFVEDDLWTVEQTVSVAKALAPGKPLWLSVGVPAHDVAAWVNPVWQARMLVAIHGAALARGADRVFWVSELDSPAAEAYSRLTSSMADVDPASIRELPTDGGSVLQTDRGWLVFQGEVAPPNGATVGLDLLSGAALDPSGPVPAPAWLSP